MTQNDRHYTEFYPYVNCVTTNFKRLSRDVYEKCCPSIENNILIKGKCNNWYNTEIKIAKRKMRHAEKKYRQDKTNELKHNEFRRQRQLKCEIVTRTKASYYKKKLKECGKDSSKIYSQLNLLLGKNKNSDISPGGKLPLPLTNNFKSWFIDKINKIMREFKTCHSTEDVFLIPNLPLKTVYVQEPITIKQIFTFIKK